MFRRLIPIALLLALVGIVVILILGRRPQPQSVQLYSAALMRPASAALPLRSYANNCKLTIGAAVDIDPLRNDAQYEQTLAREFNLVTPENAMKLRDLSTALNVYDFNAADEIVDFAAQHQMQVRGHTLIWYQGLPAWLSSPKVSKAEVTALFRRHISTLVGRYRGRVQTWDVVNEAFLWDGKLRNNVWKESVGEHYIEEAFRIARAADPDARLFYSDYGAEGAGAKSDAIFEQVKTMRQQQVPIDGVAFHMHVSLGKPPDIEAIQQNMKRLNDLGLEVQISEMDVQTQDVDLPLDEKLSQQAQVYAEVLQACLQAQNCTSFSLWGFTDQYTWIPEQIGKSDTPLIFDKAYQPKPAYTAISNTLRACCTNKGNSCKA